MSAANDYVKGYRDQQCPICEEGWFVSVAMHAARKHGQRLPGLNSRSYLGVKRAIQEDLQTLHHSDPKEVRKRHRRWATQAQREIARGGFYCKRLAALWGVSIKSARTRLHRLVEWELVPRQPRTKPRRISLDSQPDACSRGHRWTPKSTYIDSRGWRYCRICQRDSYARYNQKRRAT